MHGDLFEKTSDLLAGEHRRRLPPLPRRLPSGRKKIGDASDARFTSIGRGDLNSGHDERRRRSVCSSSGRKRDVARKDGGAGAQHGVGQLRRNVEVAAVASPAAAADLIHGLLQRTFHLA